MVSLTGSGWPGPVGGAVNVCSMDSFIGAGLARKVTFFRAVALARYGAILRASVRCCPTHQSCRHLGGRDSVTKMTQLDRQPHR
jgi:hypothetical protein